MGGTLGNIVGSVFGGGGSTSNAANDAASVQAQYQQQALDYLKQTEAAPQAARTGAIEQLSRIYGVSGDQSQQQSALNNLQGSPLYQAIMSGQKSGEEAILRNQAATGGLRSGDSNAALYNYNTQLKNQALQAGIGGLGSLAGLNSSSGQIANQISGIGQTLAQGQIAAAQNQQTSNQAGFGNLMGLGQLGLAAYNAFSDERLKDNISLTGFENGIPTFTWTWNESANELGLFGDGYGTLSKYAKQACPESVTTKHGYEQVNYSMIGVSHG